MWRRIFGVVAGIVAWIVVVSVIDRVLRAAIPGYTAAEKTLAFTMTMKLARLTMAAVTSIAAGAVVRAVAPSSRWAPWVLGFILVLLFLPEHVMIWSKLPIWYHLVFLTTLAPFVALGGAVRFAHPLPAPGGEGRVRG